MHITKGTCGSYTASICWVLLCTVCCIRAAFYQQNFAKCCKHAAQCAVFYQQLKMCKMLKMLSQQPVISSQCKNMQSWPIYCILHRPIEWISVHNLKMWFDKAKDHVHTIPRAQINTLYFPYFWRRCKKFVQKIPFGEILMPFGLISLQQW